MSECPCGHTHDDGAAHGACAAAPLSWWELWPMLAWGAYAVYLEATGRMALYLRPLYGHLAAGGGAVLLAAFAYGWVTRVRQIRAARRAWAEALAAGRRTDADLPPQALGAARPRFDAWRCARSLAFAVPLVVGLSLPERGLNALAALQRGAGDPAMLAQLALRRQEEQTQQVRGYAWTTVLGVAQHLKGPAEAKVGALGFVARPKDAKPGEFLLVRFAVTCCAADATPVAVPDRWPEAATLKDNEWVKVYGRIDPAAAALVADVVESTVAPDQPYL